MADSEAELTGAVEKGQVHCKAAYRDAVDEGDLSAVPVRASEAIDLITDLTPAADLVAVIAADAETTLLQAGQAVR
jgi:nitronate monooxygenase